MLKSLPQLSLSWTGSGAKETRHRQRFHHSPRWTRRSKSKEILFFLFLLLFFIQRYSFSFRSWKCFYITGRQLEQKYISMLPDRRWEKYYTHIQYIKPSCMARTARWQQRCRVSGIRERGECWWDGAVKFHLNSFSPSISINLFLSPLDSNTPLLQKDWIHERGQTVV